MEKTPLWDTLLVLTSLSDVLASRAFRKTADVLSRPPPKGAPPLEYTPNGRVCACGKSPVFPSTFGEAEQSLRLAFHFFKSKTLRHAEHPPYLFPRFMPDTRIRSSSNEALVPVHHSFPLIFLLFHNTMN